MCSLITNYVMVLYQTMKDILLQTGKIAFPQDVLKPEVLTVKTPCTIYAAGECPHRIAGKNDIPPDNIRMEWRKGLITTPTIRQEYEKR